MNREEITNAYNSLRSQINMIANAIASPHESIFRYETDAFYFENGKVSVDLVHTDINGDKECLEIVFPESMLDLDFDSAELEFAIQEERENLQREIIKHREELEKAWAENVKRFEMETLRRLKEKYE